MATVAAAAEAVLAVAAAGRSRSRGPGQAEALAVAAAVAGLASPGLPGQLLAAVEAAGGALGGGPTAWLLTSLLK
jgi:hypothetical protein